MSSLWFTLFVVGLAILMAGIGGGVLWIVSRCRRVSCEEKRGSVMVGRDRFVEVECSVCETMFMSLVEDGQPEDTCEDCDPDGCLVCQWEKDRYSPVEGDRGNCEEHKDQRYDEIGDEWVTTCLTI